MAKELTCGGPWRIPLLGVKSFIFLLAFSALVLPSRAANVDISPGYYQNAKLIATDLGVGDAFGSSVAISGNTAIIGVPQDDDFGMDAGCAYIFMYDTDERVWEQVAKLNASDPGPSHQFGTSVAIEGDIAFVGAPVHPPGGMVYMFERNQGGPDAWGEVRQIRGDEVTWNDYFGISMDISADFLIVGAYAGGDYDGSAYIFERDQGGVNTWGQVARLIPEDNPAYNFFGYSVAISGEIAAGGAPGYNSITGAAYIFERHADGSWLEVMQLTPDDGASQDFFGIAVDVDGNILAAGSPANEEVGAVYVYERDHGGPSAWGQSAKLIASDGIPGDALGQDVLVEQGFIFAGATRFQEEAGAIYIYERDLNGTWDEVCQLTASEPIPGEGLGNALAAGGIRLLAGANNAAAGGAVYIFTAYSPPAEINLSMVPHPGIEGEAVTLTGGFSDPDPDESHALNVQWGDGSTTTMTVPLATQVFTLTHTYLDDLPSGTPEDVYTLTVTLTDTHDGIAQAQLPVVVENMPPSIFEGEDAFLFVGDGLQRWGSFTDPGSDTWTGMVDYGDGSSVLPLELIGQSFLLEHTYTSPGVYEVIVTITDDDMGQDASQLLVNVSEPAYWQYLTLVQRW